VSSPYSHHPAMFRNNPLGFILAVLLVPLAIGVLILLYWYVKCKGTRLDVDGGSVALERGLLSKEKIELDIDSIRSVRVYQSFFNRMFGVGSIAVYTSGDLPEFEVTGMPEPQRFRELVKAANS
jgi:uncharacterized membrane protein YdbT with pleckstrin-like domain